MSKEAVKGVVDRWLNDAAFREELRQDAEGAVRRMGVELDADEWEALKSIDWSQPDAELMSRANKICFI